MVQLSMIIATLLALVHCAVEVRIAKSHSAELINNRKRVLTWWVILLISVAVLYFDGWVVTAFTYVIIFWAALELTRLLNINIDVIGLSVFSATLVGYHALSLFYPELTTVFFILPFITLIMIVVLSRGFPIIDGFRHALLLFLCIVTFFSITLINQYSLSEGNDPGLLLLVLFFITACNDIFQYVVGKTLGRTPLAPRLSQNKTLEGALGGIVLTCVLSAVVLPWLLRVDVTMSLLVGAILSTLGIGGDLFFSTLKRRANVKDSGESLPGHGGLLDRIDSLSLTAPGFGLCLVAIL